NPKNLTNNEPPPRWLFHLENEREQAGSDGNYLEVRRRAGACSQPGGIDEDEQREPAADPQVFRIIQGRAERVRPGEKRRRLPGGAGGAVFGLGGDRAEAEEGSQPL